MSDAHGQVNIGASGVLAKLTLGILQGITAAQTAKTERTELCF